MTLLDKMSALAESFPSIADAPGVRPWAPVELFQWAKGSPTLQARHAAAFVLSVWSWHHKWPGLGRFDVVLAFGDWDQVHRDAFRAWCSEPFRP